MLRNALWVIGLVIAMGIGAALGGYLAVEGTMDMMVDNAVSADAHAVRVYVDVLEELRSGETEAATERLESWLDDMLIIVMEPTNYEYGLNDNTVARADTAFMEARAYRDAFPRTSDRGLVDEMVANVWSAGPPSRFR